jgi:hypothetical protein
MAILLAAPEGRRQRGPSCRNAIMLAPPPIATRWPSPGALPERRGDAHRTGGTERHQLRGARTLYQFGCTDESVAEVLKAFGKTEQLGRTTQSPTRRAWRRAESGSWGGSAQRPSPFWLRPGFRLRTLVTNRHEKAFDGTRWWLPRKEIHGLGHGEDGGDLLQNRHTPVRIRSSPRMPGWHVVPRIFEPACPGGGRLDFASGGR